MSDKDEFLLIFALAAESRAKTLGLRLSGYKDPISPIETGVIGYYFLLSDSNENGVELPDDFSGSGASGSGFETIVDL